MPQPSAEPVVADMIGSQMAQFKPLLALGSTYGLVFLALAVLLLLLSFWLLYFAVKKRPTLSVRIFIDYANFDNSWRREGPENTNRLATHNRIDWEQLPDLLIDVMRKRGGVSAPKFSYCGTHIYVSGLPAQWELRSDCPAAVKQRFESQKEADRKRRLKFEQISLIDGYDVQFFDRQVIFRKDENGRCSGFDANEKQVDTSLTTDLLNHAYVGGFDVALLISGDSDYLPAVKVAQNALNKRIIQVGFGARDHKVRPEYWGHILLDGMLGQSLENKAEEAGNDRGANKVHSGASKKADAGKADGNKRRRFRRKPKK